MNNLFEDDGFFDEEPGDNNSNPVNSEEVDFLELVHRALDSKHSNFEFLRSAQDRTSAKIVRFSYATISKMFKKLYEATYKTYLKQVELGDQDVETLMALKQFKHCMEFYDDEAKIVDDLLDEYSEYLFSGHLLDMLLGRIRSEEDLWDHRRGGNNGK